MCTVAAWLFTGLEWLPWHRDPRQRPTEDTMPIDAHPRSSRLIWFAVLKARKVRVFEVEVEVEVEVENCRKSWNRNWNRNRNRNQSKAQKIRKIQIGCVSRTNRLRRDSNSRKVNKS